VLAEELAKMYAAIEDPSEYFVHDDLMKSKHRGSRSEEPIAPDASEIGKGLRVGAMQ
jgi:hypothetical protein